MLRDSTVQEERKKNMADDNQPNQGQGQEGAQTPPQQDPPKEEAKFTQEQLNNFASKIRAEEKAKAEKELNDYKAQVEKENERAKMTEQERYKAEKEDAEKKLQDLQNQIDYNNKKTEALKGLTDAKLDTRLIDVLMSDKSNEEKIKLMADIHKESVEQAIKDAMPAHKSGNIDKINSSKDEKFKYNFQKFK